METFKADADSLNAIVSAIGALAMVIARQLTPEQRAAMSEDLARIASLAESKGQTTLETLLIDLHRAVR